MDQPDWLADAVVEPDYLALPLPDYLAIPGLDKPSVEVVRPDAPAKAIRFQVMAGTDRVWACNGRYVACRPAGFNPTTKTRHARFLASRHYRHVGTYDDVQLFELQPGSPFYRTEGDVRAGTWYELLRAAADAAVAQDWGAYVDLLEEIAVRCKSTPTGTESKFVDIEMARQRYQDTLEWIEQLIYLRGGPVQPVVDAGVANIRQARGNPRARVIALPGPMRIQ